MDYGAARGASRGDGDNDVIGLRAEVEQLRTANELHIELLGIVGHELRNPAAVIAGFASMFERDDLPHEAREVALQSIIRQATHLGELVEDLLKTSRLLYPKPVAESGLADAVQHARLHAMDVFGPGNVDLDVHVNGEVPTMDRQSLRLVLANLIGNAIKHGTSARVEVRSRVFDDIIELDVSNEAPAIPEHERALIFEPFKQASTLSAADGVGLGLHIVKRFTEAYGGTVGVACPAGRVVFTVRLPLARAASDLTSHRSDGDARSAIAVSPRGALGG